MSDDTPPTHLSERARTLWRDLRAAYVLDDPAALELLRRMLEASDTADTARAQLAIDGLILVDRFGQVRVHPLCAVERDARLSVARLCRELCLTAPEDDPRPPRVGGGQ